MEIIAPKDQKKIIKLLKEGKVLICPTDTVYGLICPAFNKKAVERIFEIKKRDKEKPIAVFAENMAEVKKLAYVNDNQKSFLKENWPGPVTVILKAKKKLSEYIIKKGTIGIRIPDHKLLKFILKELKEPLAQTSANISGRSATTKIKDIFDQFETEDVAVVNGGDLRGGKPSKVIDFSGGGIKILRY